MMPCGAQQARDAVGRLRAALEPFADAVFFDDERGRLGERVVVAEDFEERAVPRRGRLGDDQAIRRAASWRRCGAI